MRTNLTIAKAGIARLLTAALALAIAFTFSCSYDPDKDGDGSFRMNGQSNSNHGYDYSFLNKSSYEITVTVGEKSGQKTKTLKTGATFSTVIELSVSSTTVKYIPADKVKPDGGGSTVSFHNR